MNFYGPALAALFVLREVAGYFKDYLSFSKYLDSYPISPLYAVFYGGCNPSSLFNIPLPPKEALKKELFLSSLLPLRSALMAERLLYILHSFSIPEALVVVGAFHLPEVLTYMVNAERRKEALELAEVARKRKFIRFEHPHKGPLFTYP